MIWATSRWAELRECFPLRLPWFWMVLSRAVMELIATFRYDLIGLIYDDSYWFFMEACWGRDLLFVLESC